MVTLQDRETWKKNSNNFKYHDSNYNNFVNSDDNYSKRRFQNYHLQRRTSTTTSATFTTTIPSNANGITVAAKSQVNSNANETERETSTSTPETTASIPTTNPSNVATHLPKCIKVLKLKRPVVPIINNTDITVDKTAISATNSNIRHTETQNIAKFSKNDVEPQITQIEKITEPKIPQTLKSMPPHNPSLTTKHTRRVLRKLITSVNNTSEIKDEIPVEITIIPIPKLQNVSTYDFNKSRQMKQVNSDIIEQNDGLSNRKKQEHLKNRGRNKFTLPDEAAAGAGSSYLGSGKRRRLTWRLHSSTTTESLNFMDNRDEHEEDMYGDNIVLSGDNVKEIEVVTTTSPGLRNFKYTENLVRAIESSSKLGEINGSNKNEKIETATSIDDKVETTIGNPLDELEVILGNGFKLTTTRHEIQDSGGHSLKVNPGLVKMGHEDGLVSTPVKYPNLFGEEENTENPLLKVQYKIRPVLTKPHKVQRLSGDHFKLIKIASEMRNNDGPLLMLLKSVKEELKEDIVSAKLKHHLTTPNYKVVNSEIETTATTAGNIQKTRNNMQTNLPNSDNDTYVDFGVRNLFPEQNNSTVLNPYSLDVNEGGTYEFPTDKGDISDHIAKSISTPRTVEHNTTRERPTLRRKLVAKRPYNPREVSLSPLSTTTTRVERPKGKTKYIKHGIRNVHSLNSGNHKSNDSNSDPRINKLLPNYSFKKEELSIDQKNENYDEYEGELLRENELQKLNPVQVIKSNSTMTSNVFKRPQATAITQFAEDDVDYGKEKNNAEQELGKFISTTSFKYKKNSTRPNFNITATTKKLFTSKYSANSFYRPGSFSSTTPGSRANLPDDSAKSTTKAHMINHPLGAPVPNLTIKPVVSEPEHTTVLIHTKPFINSNTRSYERKYSGPTTESSVGPLTDSNFFIEDINIEALNARNKKIFDINSKKHTPLKTKIILPLPKQNDNTQQQTNTQFKNRDNYQSDIAGFATNTYTQEHEQSTTLDNIKISTQNTDGLYQNNVNNLNEISSQDVFNTTPSSSSFLLHIFTLSDAEHTTPNLLSDVYQDNPRFIVDRMNPKHKVVEINRIVEVNSKEEKLRRKLKANTIRPVEGSESYKVESLPHVEQLGEISVVKYVHQVDGTDITIEGRSTVAEYTPTEPTFVSSFKLLRYNSPDDTSPRRYGKALLPEVLSETVETSTIPLEGLFETKRSSKVLDAFGDAAFVRAPQHRNIKNGKIIGNLIETNNLKSEPSSEAFELSTSSSAIDQNTLTAAVVNTTLSPEVLKPKSSTSENIQYVRPIVPFLRPESNESSLLVISIANLDKVILSKVSKMINGAEVEQDVEHQEPPAQQTQSNNLILGLQTEYPNVIPPYKQTTVETHTQENYDIHDSQADFSSNIDSAIESPLIDSLIQKEKHLKKKANATQNSLEKIPQITQTEHYAISRGDVGTTTSSTMGSKISGAVSFSSEITVVRSKQKSKAKMSRGTTIITRRL